MYPTGPAAATALPATLPGQRCRLRGPDTAAGSREIGVCDGRDDDRSGLSVAEIQYVFRELGRDRERREAGAGRVVTVPAGRHRPANSDTSRPHLAAAARRRPQDPSVGPAEPARANDRLGAGWITVVSAHGGAGASCVALAITDSLSGAQRTSRLIELAPPARSGLVAAATAELGVDLSGAWRRGSRLCSTLYRWACDSPPADWPAAVGPVPPVTVVDLGLPNPTDLTRLSVDGPDVVVVCRASVPGLRAAEGLLAALDGAPVVLAAVGSGRWPNLVNASVGPLVRDLRIAGRIVTVPADRHLQLSGPDSGPLPPSVTAAGRALLALLDTARPDGITPPPPAPRTRGTRR